MEKEYDVSGEKTYDVLRNYELSDLVREVNEFLKDGWQLQGGIAVIYQPINGVNDSKQEIAYYQALVKEEIPPWPR